MIIGTTFEGCTEPHSDLIKILLSAKRKIFNKCFHDYKTHFLRNHFKAQDRPYPAKPQLHLACLLST